MKIYIRDTDTEEAYGVDCQVGSSDHVIGRLETVLEKGHYDRKDKILMNKIRSTYYYHIKEARLKAKKKLK